MQRDPGWCCRPAPATTPAPAMRAILSRVSVNGGVTSPLARRWRSRRMANTLNAATAADHDDPAGGHAEVAVDQVVEHVAGDPDGAAGAGPAVVERKSSRPSKPSRPARVTTNDGRRSRVTIKPCRAPMAW